MKDKRQKMAFNWPYGDPQMFMHMLSAVAASTNYNSNNTSNSHQTSSEAGQYQCPKLEASKNELLLMSSPQFNRSFTKSSLSPSSEVSSSSACSSTDSSPALKAKQTSENLISPISLHIPSMQAPSHFYNYPQPPVHQYMPSPYGAQFAISNHVMPTVFTPHQHPGMFVDSSSVSFKLPAFGLGNNEAMVHEHSSEN